jgi:hypothetical protein
MTERQRNFGFPFFLLVLIGISGGQVLAGGLIDTSAEAFDQAEFIDSELITNPWWTLPAGNNWLYFAEDECEWNLVEVLTLVTDEFEGIYAGTNARIVLDRAWADEECEYDNFVDVYTNIEPEETTYDWYAQDTNLNIWYMGEDTFDGESSEGSFIAGCDGAEAGIVILGNPEKGNSYQQEYYEDEAEDWGKVLNFIPDDDLICMKTKEWTPLEPGSVEHKYYCSDGTVGELSLIEELQGGKVVVELVDTNVESPPLGAGPPFPIPDCPED